SAYTPFSIKSLPEALRAIEENLEAMKHDERDLRRTQAILKKKRNSYISPVNTLPPELLAHVFTIAATPVSKHSSSNKCIKRTISRVCSLWRQIALDVCPVWDKVSLTFYDTSEDQQGWAEIELSNPLGRQLHVPVSRP
ncbi:hypothetical protein BDV93DRAFT_401578, partial [Ceratobasidium sp. AG-I]